MRKWRSFDVEERAARLEASQWAVARAAETVRDNVGEASEHSCAPATALVSSAESFISVDLGSDFVLVRL